MKSIGPTPHRFRRVWIAASALLTALATLAAVHLGMARLIRERTEEFDIYPFPEKLIGLALQRQVFADAALLPVYGSSELTQPQTNRADAMFSKHATGFGTFLIGNPGETCLIIATKLAALDDVTHGKRAVVFLSPGWFLEPELDHKGFGVNFSPLQGNVLAFQSKLSSPLKRDLALRLLDYPETVGQSNLLNAALQNFAHPSPVNAGLAAALSPLGRGQLAVQREMEYLRLWSTWRIGRKGREPAKTALRKARPAWPALLEATEQGLRNLPFLTSYSVGPPTPYDAVRKNLFRDTAHPETTPDEVFSRACLRSKEWTDFDLLLRIAAEKGIRLLVVCQPINTNFGQLQGLSAASVTLFYGKLAKAVAPYRVRLKNFPEAETDAHFYQDSVHPSAKGWLAYDAALDDFSTETSATDQTDTQ